MRKNVKNRQTAERGMKYDVFLFYLLRKCGIIAKENLLL